MPSLAGMPAGSRALFWLFVCLLVTGLFMVPACGPAKAILDGTDRGFRSGDDTGDDGGDVCPMPVAITRPATLLVAVRDVEGTPVSDASVIVDGRGTRTDAHGDTSFERLPPGDVNVVVQRAGYAPGARRVALVEGGQHQVTVTMVAESGALVLDPSEDTTLSGEGTSLLVPADALARLDSEPSNGSPTLSWTWFSSDRDGVFPASPLGVSASGEDVSLRLLGAVEISATDEAGRALRLAEGEKVKFSQVVETNATDVDCTTVSAWGLDPWTGRWIEAADVDVSTIATGGEIALRASLPQVGTWAFGVATAPGCLDVSVDACPGLSNLPLEVRVDGLGTEEMQAVSAVVPRPEFNGLVPGDVQVSLLANGVVLNTTSATVGAGDACTSVSLSPQECSGLAVAVQTDGSCPAQAAEVSVTSGSSGASFVIDADGLALLPTLSAGPWRAQLIGTDGHVLDTADLTLGTDGMSSALLQGSGLSASTPEGGCAQAPCSGEDCDACLVVDVYGDGSLPAAGVAVDTCDPAADGAETNDAGQACVDAPDGIGAELVFDTPAGWVADAALRSAGTCGEPATCTERELPAGKDISVGDDWTPWDAPPLLLGWMDPGWSDGDPDLSDWVLSGTTLALEVESGALNLSSDEGATGLRCEDDVYSVLALDADAVGMLWPGDTAVRCETAFGTALALTVQWPDAPMLPGLAEIGDDGLAVQMRVTPEGGAATSWDAESGTVDVIARGGGQLDLNLDLTFAAASGSARVTGEIGARLVSRADAPRVIGQLAAPVLTGVFTRVHAVSTGRERSFGPSNVGGLALDPVGTGPESKIWLPLNTAAYAYGERAFDALFSVTPLMMPRTGRIKLYKSADLIDAALVPKAMYSLRRETAEMMYRAAGRNIYQMDEGGTIIGRPARWDAARGRLIALNGYGAASLRAPDGSTLHATPLDTSLQVTTPGNASLFAFLGVPPATPDNPYVLTLKDSAGTVIKEYTQRLVAMAGGVTVMGWDAAAP